MYREAENENLKLGFICLCRSIRQNWIWKDSEKFQWWVDILMTVNHSDKKVLIAGKLFECKRGESLNSLQTWAQRWHTDVSSVRRFFALLQKDGMIQQKSETKTTRLTVCNYDTYNGERHDNDRKTTRRKHADSTQTAANNNDNNENNVNRPAAPVLNLYTEEQKIGFEKFTTWVATHAPSVAKMKEPFTIDQYLKLKAKLSWQKIADLIESMEIWEGLKKRTSAYKTILTFYKRETEKQTA